MFENLKHHNLDYSPGQVLTLQSAVSVLFPAHVLPPFEGGGLEHARLLCFVPDPHVSLQVLYSPQEDQAPSIARIECNDEKNLYSFREIAICSIDSAKSHFQYLKIYLSTCRLHLY